MMRELTSIRTTDPDGVERFATNATASEWTAHRGFAHRFTDTKHAVQVREQLEALDIYQDVSVCLEGHINTTWYGELVERMRGRVRNLLRRVLDDALAGAS